MVVHIIYEEKKKENAFLDTTINHDHRKLRDSMVELIVSYDVILEAGSTFLSTTASYLCEMLI